MPGPDREQHRDRQHQRGVASHWIGSWMISPSDWSTLLMNPLRSNSQRQARPIAMLPLTAGTK